MAKDLTENISELCLREDHLLTPLERTLIDNLLERQEGSSKPELKNEIASAVAETLAQRATQTLQTSLSKRLLAEWDTRKGAVKLQRQPSPGPQPMAPRPPSPTPGPAPSPSAIFLQGGPPPAGTGAPRPPSPPPGPAPSPSAIFLQGGPPPAGTGAPRPPSPPPGPAPSPGGISSWQNSISAVAVADQEVVPASCVVFEEFLAPAELEALMRYAQLSEPQYRVSEVISPGVQGSSVDFEYRRSMVLFELGDPGAALVERARAYLPRVLEKLGRQPFRVGRAEAQITASNDGDFFRWHCDDGQGEISTREITFVYFLHREPKPFRGGELRIYDSRKESGAFVPTENYRVVVPRQNQIAFFPSSLTHEITPVECSSKAFVDSRFTVNGWFHR